MRRKAIQLFFISAVCAGMLSCSGKKQESNADLDTDVVKNTETASGESDENAPVIDLEKETHDFGRITQGEKLSYSFKFKNTGKSDLIISDAKGSCGCTVPNYPTQPIAPGDEGVIDVTFDSSGKEGKQTKTVTLLTNCNPATKVITIIGEVVAAPSETK